MGTNLWRTNVNMLRKYIPGKAIEEVKKEHSLEEIIRLASNENPFGPSPKAVRAMQEALYSSQLYPESTCKELREKIGDKHQLNVEQIVISNGADQMIRLVASAYINEGDEVIYCTPTFPTYRTVTLVMGGIPKEIPMNSDYIYDLEAILERVNDQTKLIFICNPNNPTGTILDSKNLKSFLERLPDHVIVVLDEAYIEFVQDPNQLSGIDYIKEGYPVISIRTFSKLYGLAGIRVGYALGNSDLLLPIQMVREPFAVNRMASLGAMATLEDEKYLKEVLEKNNIEKDKLSRVLEKMDYDVYTSHTNFLFVNMKQDTTLLSEKLMRKGIIIRPCTAWGLRTFARISIGTPTQNDQLINMLQELSYSNI